MYIYTYKALSSSPMTDCYCMTAVLKVQAQAEV